MKISLLNFLVKLPHYFQHLLKRVNRVRCCSRASTLLTTTKRPCSSFLPTYASNILPSKRIFCNFFHLFYICNKTARICELLNLNLYNINIIYKKGLYYKWIFAINWGKYFRVRKPRGVRLEHFLQINRIILQIDSLHLLWLIGSWYNDC